MLLVYKTSALPLDDTGMKAPLAKTGETGPFSKSQSRNGESNSGHFFTREAANHWYRHVGLTTWPSRPSPVDSLTWRVAVLGLPSPDVTPASARRRNRTPSGC